MKKLLMAGGAAALMTATTAYSSIIDRPFFQVLGTVVVWGADGMDGAAPVVTDFVLLTPASGAAGADLIAGDGATVVTGTLDPIAASGINAGATVADPVTGALAGGGVLTDDGNGILDAADTLTSFGLDASTDVDSGMVNTHESSFYVASNAAFDIYAQSTAATATGDFLTDGIDETDISFTMAVTVSGNDGLAFGGNAQDPSTGGTGVIAGVDDLGDMLAATKVFDGGQRTAATRGSLTAQSVRFDNTYDLQLNGTTDGYDLSMGVGTLTADVTYTIYVP